MKMPGLLTIIAILTLSGCGFSNYRAAQDPGDYGYTETRLQNSIYRLHYQSPRSANGAQASDYALLRAAELTLSHNYQYFVILDRDDEVRNRTNRIRGHRRTDITYDNYDYATGSGSGTAVTQVIGGSTSQFAEPRSLLLIQFVDNKKPIDGKPAYDAQYVKDAIKKKYDLKT